jgi:peptidoglycan DL-endopeptidase CwlO
LIHGAAAVRLLARLVLALMLIGVMAAAVVSRQSGPGSGTGRTPQAITAGRSSAHRGRPATSPTTVSPTTTTVGAPAVAPMGQLRTPSVIVTLSKPVTTAELQAIGALKGVDAIDVVDIGTVALQGAPAVTLGVNPGTFRNFTPAASAGADRLWQYISGGTLASSFEMSRERKLALGVQVPVVAVGSGPTTLQWLGAFMSIGLPGIDLVVSHQMSATLGLPPNSGLVLSAPSADPFVLQTALKNIAPGASVVLMRPGLAVGTGSGAAGLVSSTQLSTALTAALSRVGKPYVWGGTGPNGFDCSGLVGWSFAAAGVSLPRTAAEQALAGPAVPLSQLQPGDLLFWSYDPTDPGFIDHVAIYVGRGQMIEAPQTGDAVHVIAIPSRPVGAVRINPGLSARMGGPWGP